LFSLPAALISEGAWPPPWALITGLIIFIGSGLGVHLADKQLWQFRATPLNKGKTCQIGLWRYSRHPNYFFEWLHWFAYPFIAWHSPLGHWLWLGPVVMFCFLYFITGIPFSEQQAIRSRGQAYKDYQRTTSMFIPWRTKS
jgi:cyclopropane-fatty-acyl-phospholipid synthase